MVFDGGGSLPRRGPPLEDYRERERDKRVEVCVGLSGLGTCGCIISLNGLKSFLYCFIIFFCIIYSFTLLDNRSFESFFLSFSLNLIFILFLV